MFAPPQQGQKDFAIILANAIFNRLYIELYIKFVANNGKNRDSVHAAISFCPCSPVITPAKCYPIVPVILTVTRILTFVFILLHVFPINKDAIMHDITQNTAMLASTHCFFSVRSRVEFPGLSYFHKTLFLVFILKITYNWMRLNF